MTRRVLSWLTSRIRTCSFGHCTRWCQCCPAVPAHADCMLDFFRIAQVSKMLTREGGKHCRTEPLKRHCAQRTKKAVLCSRGGRRAALQTSLYVWGGAVDCSRLLSKLTQNRPGQLTLRSCSCTCMCTFACSCRGHFGSKSAAERLEALGAGLSLELQISNVEYL